MPNSGMNMRGPGIDLYETPRPLFGRLHDEFRFTVDAAASPHNALLPKFWTQEQDGLKQIWANERVWVNPPYSDIGNWTAKACLEPRAQIIVMLLPATTGAEWFHRDVLRARAEIRFMRKRIRFLLGGVRQGSPRFDSMIVIWRPIAPSVSVARSFVE